MTVTNDSSLAQLLAVAQQTPIAQLGPDLSTPASRIVRGEITITWPYNSLKQTLAFLLADPDVRLRRSKGQVRVELQGPSAKAAAACNLGGGDQLVLSLDGVEWTKDQSTARLPGSRIEWQLTYTGKLLLEVKSSEDEQGVKYVNIDEPVSVDNAELVPAPLPDPIEREITPPTPAQSVLRRVVANDEPDVYASPAFIKRARVSYGSLFEGGFDIFEDDGGVKGKGRKRTRFGRDSSAWRYASHSPSPEPEEEPSSEPADITRETALSSSPRARMTDEGCQTVELDVAPAPPMSEPASPKEQPHPPQTSESALALPLPPTTVNGIGESAMAVDIPTQEPPQSEGLTTSSEPFGSALFGSFMPSGDAYDLNPFPTADTTIGFGENQVPISDQVRFGFAQPIASMEPAPEPMSGISEPPIETYEHYPEQHLEPGHTSLQHAGFGFEEREAASALIAQQSSFGMASVPPVNHTEIHEEGMVWPITSTTLDAQHAEGHVDLALPPEPTADGSEIDPASRSPTRQALPREVDDYGYNARRYQNEAEERMVGMVDRPEDDEDEDDSEDDAIEHNDEEPDDAGDDYDMRNYADVDDDEEGFERYDDEEGGEYSEGEMLSPDDEEGSFDEEEEEEYDSDEEEEERHGAGQPPSQSPAQPGPPVVIDLISDSEDEDVPPPRPATQVTASTIARSSTENAPAAQQSSEADYEDEEDEVVRQDASASASGQPPAAPGSLEVDERDDGQHSPSYEVQVDEDDEDSEEDAMGESEEESEEEDVDGESDTLEPARPSSPQNVDEDEPLADEEMVEEQRVEISETVRLTQHGDQISHTVSKTVSTAAVEADVEMEIVETVVDTRSSPVRSSEPEILPTASAGISDNEGLEDNGHRHVAPSSPPQSQQFKSQVLGDQPFILSSPLPPSQSQTDQLPTPLETQANEEPSSQHGNDMLINQDGQMPAAASSPVHKSDALPQVGSTDEVEEEVELVSARPKSGDKEEDVSMADEIHHISQVATIEEVSVETPGQPAASSPIPEDKELVTEQEQEQAEVNTRSEETINVSNDLAGKEQSSGPAEAQMVPNEAEEKKEESLEQDPKLLDKSSVEEHSTKQQDESKRDEEPATSTPSEGPAVHTRSRTKDTKEQAPAKATTRTKAKPVPIDPSIQLARAARRGKRLPEPESPTVTTRARSRSIQPSATPELPDASIHLAKAAHQSPSRKTQQPPLPPPPPAVTTAKTGTVSAASLKLDLAKRLRTDLQECVALKTIKSHLNRKLDVLAIATTASSKPNRLKTRQYALSFNVTDPTLAPLHVVEVQVYRAHKDSLPTVNPGDGVLLRGFQVVALTGKDFGLRSDEASGYAVFEQEGPGEPQVNGPPVEDIGTESAYAESLKEWYGLLDGTAKDKLAKANQKFADVGSGKSK